MKISDNTYDVLKNFSTINQSLAFKAGNVVRTVSPQKNILAQAKVSESFPMDFAIYELNQFLGLASLFEDAEVDFGDRNMVISEGTAKANYTYADPSMITTPPENNIDLPSVDVSFDMNKSDLKQILNGANQLQLPEVVVRSNNGIIELAATDTKNPTSNEFVRTVGEHGANFKFIFKTENMKFLQKDYKVSISSKGIAHFAGDNVEYWVATEAGSNFDG
jgi:hypothetical protein